VSARGRGSGQASEPRAATPRGAGGRAGAAPWRTRLTGRRARGSGRRTKPRKRAGEPRAATPRHPPRRARRGEEQRGKGTGRRGAGRAHRWRGRVRAAAVFLQPGDGGRGASGERFAREREKNASSWEGGDEQGATTEAYRRAPRGGRRRLGDCSARTSATGAGKPLGGWAASQPACGPRGEKTGGGRLGRASSRVGP
jgi:hypothetical protein